MKLSASALSTFRRCPRKWAFQKIDKLPDPSGPAAELGNRVHAVLEEYLENGTPPNGATLEGRIALAGLPLLPSPRSGVVEEWFEFSVGPYTFHGRMDWHRYWPKGQKMDAWATVLDHKTTSDLSYAKTPDGLSGDIQATLYAAAMFAKGAKEVILEWIYYQTKDPHKTKKVHLRVVNNPQTSEAFKEVLDTAEMLHFVKDNYEKAIDVPPHVSACEDFGGCTFKKICNFTTEEKGKHFMNPQFAALKAKIEANNAAKAATSNVAPPTVHNPASAAPDEVPTHEQITAHQEAFSAGETEEKAPKETKAKTRTVKKDVVRKEADTFTEAAPAVDARTQIATALYAAAISRGEASEDDLDAANRAVSRADVLIRALG